MMKAYRLLSHCMIIAGIALILALSAHQGLAQDKERAKESADAVLSRLGGLDIERSRGSVDTELAARHNRRGNTYSNLDRLEDAIREYQLSIAADPNQADSIRNLANIYYFQERYDEAIPYLARYIRLQTEITTPLISALQTLGELLRSRQQYEEAIAIDLRTIEVSPDNDSQVHIMGNTYNNAGRIDLAIQIYAKAIEVMPENAFFYRTLGRLYESEAQLAEALAQYRTAAELEPDSRFYQDLVSGLEARLAQ
ncbi:MAG: tetratricopeptide repeat protein [Pseudomonadales bacterium]|nr:tetratricopeptide repeat protein [Pseudomonadales bacterium]